MRLPLLCTDELLRTMEMDEAIRLLEELKAKTEKEEWAIPAMKRAVLSGVMLSIQRLKEAKANGDGNAPGHTA